VEHPQCQLTAARSQGRLRVWVRSTTYTSRRRHLILSCRQRAHSCVPSWITTQIRALPPPSCARDIGASILGRQTAFCRRRYCGKRLDAILAGGHDWVICVGVQFVLTTAR
jgi:hypothetical protein